MKKIEAANEEKRKRKISVGLKVFSAISKMKMSVKKPTSSPSPAGIANGSEVKSEHQPNGNNMEGSSSETANVGSGANTNYTPPANGDKLFSAVNKMKMALKQPTTSSSEENGGETKSARPGNVEDTGNIGSGTDSTRH